MELEIPLILLMTPSLFVFFKLDWIETQGVNVDREEDRHPNSGISCVEKTVYQCLPEFEGKWIPTS